MAAAEQGTAAEHEANELMLQLYTKLNQLEAKSELGKDGIIYGENIVSKDILARRKRDIAPNDATYCFCGMTSNVGAGYCIGSLGGALAGTYLGLADRLKAGQTRLTWRMAGTAMFHMGSKYGTMYGNRLGAAAFAICCAEAGLREMVLRQGREEFAFRKYNEEDVPYYMKDSRLLTPLATMFVIPAMRHRRPLPTIISSTVLMMLGTALYSHSFTAENYFDIRKGWDLAPDADLDAPMA